MGTSASFARKISACLVAALLSLALVPAFALAEDGHSGAEGSEGAFGSEVPTSPQPPSDPSTEASGSDVTLNGAAEGGEVEGSNKRPLTLASGLVGKPNSFINSDVALDSEPVIGSFTVDGLTFAVIDESHVELVGVSPDWQQVMSSQEGEDASVAPMLASGSDGAESDAAALTLLETVTYEGTTYTLASIASYAFYLSGVASATLPASVSDVDERAFRSSDVESVTVAEGNPFFSSFDGVLYDVDKLSLLLIPEGKQGAVILPKEAEAVPPSSFSHCSLVDTVSVEDGSAAFASENGLLYTSDLTTLLRVPAGATEITIRDGCTTIAAGALEACAKLTTINAPASVTSISPDIFHSIPTVSLPAASLTESAPQITAMVALSSVGDGFPGVDLGKVAVYLADDANCTEWKRIGLRVELKERGNSDDELVSELTTGALSKTSLVYTVYGNGGEVWYRNSAGAAENWLESIYATTWADGWSVSGNLLRWSGDSSIYLMARRTGYTQTGWGRTSSGSAFANGTTNDRWGSAIYALWRANAYSIRFEPNGGAGTVPDAIDAVYDKKFMIPAPELSRKGYVLIGWSLAADGEVVYPKEGPFENLTAIDKETVALYAQWEPVDYNLGFDVDSEPGNGDYPGIEKPDQTVNIEDGPTAIEGPKRPGYVFQGWTIPNAEGTEAIDQDLVYQDETDGKWYVDASKLPDYAGDDGRVELTARWTSVISVDVPSSVTFYADVVTQGNESREGLASSAFGQSKVQSQSEVDLRIVGLESKQVKGNGSTSLGASDILKKKDGSALPATSDKLFSLYPATGELKEDDLKDPDATSASKPAGAVDFSLDDILLEKSFAADKFTIPAEDTLSLGYRLNLQETGTELDYDKLSTLSEGASASIANISYCFAADLPAGPFPTGSKTDPLWVENTDPDLGLVGVYGLNDIKAAAADLAAHAGDLEQSKYYSFYKGMLDRQVAAGPYFQLKVAGAKTGYLDLQLIGIAQDFREDGSGKAGFTFQTKDIYAYDGATSIAAGSGAFDTVMDAAPYPGTRGWEKMPLRTTLEAVFKSSLDQALQDSLVPVKKAQQLAGGTDTSKLQLSTEIVFLPSVYEVYGAALSAFNESEQYPADGYEPFQYLAYRGNDGSATNPKATKAYNGTDSGWWLRSCYRSSSSYVCLANPDGACHRISSFYNSGVAPAFCL